MTPQKPDHSGRFVKKSLVRPAVEVDCSTWNDADPAGKWTTGRFVKKSLVRPAVEVDCSGWPEPPTLSIELTLSSESTVDPVQLAFGLLDVLDAVNELDRALGGTGLTRVAGQQINGAVTLTLAPAQQSGAADRIRRISEQHQPADTDYRDSAPRSCEGHQSTSCLNQTPGHTPDCIRREPAAPSRCRISNSNTGRRPCANSPASRR